MAIKFLKDHLPWLAPSAAIVFAASGYFDRGSKTETAVVEPAPAVQSAQAASFESTARALQGLSASSNAPAQNTSDVVTRLSTASDTSLQAIQPQQASPLELAVARSIEQVAPTEIESKPEPVAVKTASVAEPAFSSDFFANAQANLAAQESCVADLRAVADQARVYFPAGGLNADNGGIEQARLIGSLAQDCQGVQIVVEGHSDPSGDPAVNLRLSKKRAEHVIQRLSASGIDTSQFVAQGMGSQSPSKVVGPEKSAYYDRRVEFVVIETQGASNKRARATPAAWASSTCVKDLHAAISETKVFYAPRSVAAKQSEMQAALRLANMAVECPNARLRVIGQHSDDLRAGEGPATGRLRAKAMMAMLVGQGIDSEQIIIAAPSRSFATEELSGSRLDFDVILD